MGVKSSLRRVKKILQDPATYLRAIYRQRRIQLTEKVSKICSRRAFYVQSRMDIDQKSPWYSDEFIQRSGGFFLAKEAVQRDIVDFEPWDMVRRDMIVLLLRTLNASRVEGDIVELGVYRGLTAKLLHHYMPDRTLHLFDTFKGFDPINITRERRETGISLKPSHFSNTSVETVLNHIKPRNDRIRIYPGFFPDTIPVEFNHKQFAFVHLDADLYEPTAAGLEYFYPRLSPGGCLLVHDYNAWPGARKAVDEFFANKPDIPIPMPDKSGSVLVVKSRLK